MNDRMNVTGGRTRRGLRRLALLFLAVMMTLSFAMTSAAAYDDINAALNDRLGSSLTHVTFLG